jgi:hypothetical protein
VTEQVIVKGRAVGKSTDVGAHALADFYELLDVKQYEPRYGRKRSQNARSFRKSLNRIIGAHDWASADKWGREIIEEARRLRRYLRHRPPTMGNITGWYFFQRIREESITRRILPPSRLGG